VVVAVLAGSGCSVSIDFGDDDVTERTETEQVAASDIERIDVETGNGAIEIVGADTDTIELTATLRESDEGDATYVVERIDDALVVEGECDGGWSDECSVGLELVVPAELDVVATTDNGRIDLDGVRGAVRADSDNGAITGDDLASVFVDVETDNGQIELVFATPPDDVTATTDNGAVTIRYPDDGGSHDVRARSDNGSVDVDVRDDPAAERRLVVETDNGSIDIAYGS
jgi:DUF4097 and DUF4098 domain-containing protein YvlB